jgi:hypothetical protein
MSTGLDTQFNGAELAPVFAKSGVFLVHLRNAGGEMRDTPLR